MAIDLATDAFLSAKLQLRRHRFAAGLRNTASGQHDRAVPLRVVRHVGNVQAAGENLIIAVPGRSTGRLSEQTLTAVWNGIDLAG